MLRRLGTLVGSLRRQTGLPSAVSHGRSIDGLARRYSHALLFLRDILVGCDPSTARREVGGLLRGGLSLRWRASSNFGPGGLRP
jgi:hypothetical protein